MQSALRDPYQTLGVRRTATGKDIVDAYRRLAMKWHPDRHPSDAAKAYASGRMKDINVAYDALSDPARRANYNSENPVRPTHTEKPSTARRDSPESSNKPAGPMMKIHLTIPIADAIFGGTAEIEPYREMPCYECRGDGFDFNDHRCGRCSGDGYISDKASGFTLRVRPGVVNGSVLVAKGRGGQAPHGGVPGDLHITIKVASETNWIVSGLSLHGNVRVPFSTALLGGYVLVEMPGGLQRRVLVPQHTDSGVKLRIPQGGLFDALNDLRGDAFVRVTISLPPNPKTVTSSTERTIRDLYT